MATSTAHTFPATEPASTELGLTTLLGALLTLVVAERVFALPLSMGPGLSLENALLYVVLAALFFKMAVRRSFRFELRELHVCFALLIAYAALTIVAAALIVQYPGYRPLRAIVAFKARLVDQLVFFAVFFYGLQRSRSALNLLKLMFLLMVGANLLALLNAWGYVEAEGLVHRDDGRAQGVMGESNQSAAFIASFLPGLVGLTLMSKGVTRLMWLGGTCVAAMALLICASRGGLVALAAASLWGLIRFRKYVSIRSMGAILGAATLIGVAAVPVVATRFGDLLINRFIGDTTSVDVVDVSSGRLDIWAGAFATMAETPVTFLSGFGWAVYDSMPFRLSPHNHYVALWFDLGLVGLICGTALLVLALRAALEVLPLVNERYRNVLISFSVGTVAIAIATFFVDLYTPWLWFWAYAGLVLRIAANARTQARADVARAAAADQPAPEADMFGWIATTRR